MSPPGLFKRRGMVSGVALLGIGGLVVCLGQLQPAGDASRVAVLEIAEGESLSEVARRLYAHRMIHNKRALVWMSRLGGLDRRIIPGEYVFHAGMTPLTILGKLTAGEVRLYTVTIPEGFSSQQIADLLHEKHLVDPMRYMRLTVDSDFIRTLSLRVNDLEGYLFPDTYRFARHMEPEHIIRTMVARFRQVMTKAYRTRAEQLGLSVYQVLTLASLIEKETARPDERALISGVFHNRLRQKIPLQSDPTVIYLLENFDGNLRKHDLLNNSPYNTYHVAGLPYGPIANPGKAAIHAALYPAFTEYLYFVSRNDGSHEFSATFADHQRAVEKYQLRQRRRSS